MHLGWDEKTNYPKKRKLNESDKNIAKFIRMQGSTSTSESYKVALNFAQSADSSKNMVLFVFCLHNWFGMDGFRMNAPQFTAHPDEREILLMEGASVCVMEVD